MNAPDPVLPPQPPRKRRRPALSCAECRRRKIKCDRAMPCSPCVASRSPSCTYTPQVRRSAEGPELAQSYHSSAVPLRPVLSTQPSDMRSGERLVPGRGIDSISVPVSPDVQVLRARVRDLEHLLATSTSNALPTPPAGEHLQARHAGSLHKSRYFSRDHWIHTFKELQHFRGGEGAEHANCANAGRRLPEVRELLQECKAVVKQVKSALSSPLPATLDFRSYVPSRDLADLLVLRYFQTQEAAYRILHFPSFLREYAGHWSDPGSSSTEFVLQLLLVMAIGSGPESDLLRYKARQWVMAIEHWMSLPSGKGRLGMAVLQIRCLLLLARQTTGVDEHLLYISAGTILREAICMGYHRDPQNFPELYTFQCEMRKRLWATIIEMNLQFALDSALPPQLVLEDFDTTPPANVNDTDFDDTTQGYLPSKPENVFTGSSAQIAMLKSHQIRLKTINLVKNLQIDPTYEETLRLSSELAAFRNTSYHNFQPDAQAGRWWLPQALADRPTFIVPQGPTPMQHRIADLMILRFVLALHRSFTIKSRPDPRFYYSRKLSLDTALTMLSHLSSATEIRGSLLTNLGGILQPSDDDAIELKSCSGTLSKEVVMHTSLIILSELIFRLDEEPAALLESSKASRAPLLQAMRELIDIHAERTRLGENFKGHFFLSMALGQVEAMEAKTSVEQGIIEAARVSAETCIGLLKSRLTSVLGTASGESQSVAVGGEVTQDIGLDFSLQDSGMDFFGADAWPFLDWDENGSW